MPGGCEGTWCNDPSKCQRLRAILRLAVVENGGRIVLRANDADEMRQYELIIRECEEGLEAVTQSRYPAIPISHQENLSLHPL